MAQASISGTCTRQMLPMFRTCGARSAARRHRQPAGASGGAATQHWAAWKQTCALGIMREWWPQPAGCPAVPRASWRMTQELSSTHSRKGPRLPPHLVLKGAGVDADGGAAGAEVHKRQRHGAALRLQEQRENRDRQGDEPASAADDSERGSSFRRPTAAQNLLSRSIMQSHSTGHVRTGAAAHGAGLGRPSVAAAGG